MTAQLQNLDTAAGVSAETTRTSFDGVLLTIRSRKSYFAVTLAIESALKRFHIPKLMEYVTHMVMRCASVPRSVARALVVSVASIGVSDALKAQETSPWGQGDNPAAVQADALYQHYRFRDGEVLDTLRIHYATLGTPHRGKDGEIDNAVLVLHWTGSDGRAVLTPTYMKALYNPGRPLDARRYYLIVPDNVGHGRSSKPSDGLKMKFPNYGYADIVDLQHKLVTETLGVRRLHAILGMSMGGMNAWQWAEAYPDAMGGIMPVVSLPTKVSGRNLIWRHLAMNYIRDDPCWAGGDYARPFRGWVEAYELLHMMIEGVPHLQAIAPDGASADAFIAEGERQAAAGDANDVLYSLKSSADYDPEPGLAAIRTRVFALNFDDDEFNPNQLHILQRLTPQVPGARYVVQRGSATTFGHLTMAHPDLWSQHVTEFMRELGDTP